MKDNIMQIIDFNGVEKSIEVLKYFELKKNGKDYIIYKDEGNKNYLVYAAEVVESDDEVILKEISDEDIKKTIEDIMENIKNG